MQLLIIQVDDPATDETVDCAVIRQVREGVIDVKPLDSEHFDPRATDVDPHAMHMGWQRLTTDDPRIHLTDRVFDTGSLGFFEQRSMERQLESFRPVTVEILQDACSN